VAILIEMEAKLMECPKCKAKNSLEGPLKHFSNQGWTLDIRCIICGYRIHDPNKFGYYTSEREKEFYRIGIMPSIYMLIVRKYGITEEPEEIDI